MEECTFCTDTRSFKQGDTELRSDVLLEHAQQGVFQFKSLLYFKGTFDTDGVFSKTWPTF